MRMLVLNLEEVGGEGKAGDFRQHVLRSALPKDSGCFFTPLSLPP